VGSIDIMNTKHLLAASLALTFTSVAHVADAASSCAALAKFTMPEHRIVIRHTQEVAEPAHCRIDGVIDERTGRDGKPYGIGFAVALPANWNGRFLFQVAADSTAACSRRSGAAYAGERSALARGFAVASTDSGHQSTGFDASFFRDQQATLDFLYQAVAEVTVVAKTMVRTHYGKAQQHAYFVGCSTADARR
jgi:feruloyl esterase